MRDDDYDDDRPTPAPVVAAVGFGTLPLPFLAVYAVLFLLHGSVKPVHPPDITSSQSGEFIAGLVALAAFIVMTVTLLWFLNARRRWPFAIVQLAMFALAVDFLVDDTKGGRIVSLLVLLASGAALVLGFVPASWAHVGRPVPSWLTRAYAASRRASGAGDPDALPVSSPVTEVEPATLRRRRRRVRSGKT